MDAIEGIPGVIEDVSLETTVVVTLDFGEKGKQTRQLPRDKFPPAVPTNRDQFFTYVIDRTGETTRSYIEPLMAAPGKSKPSEEKTDKALT